MCIFQSGHDIPPLVRLALRTLQYLVIPLLSTAIICVGVLHLGECAPQPLLPVWHIVAGASGLATPVFYLLFDEVNPSLSRRFPGCSEFLDNVVVFLLPVYIVFELAWLVTGSVWLVQMEERATCDHTLYVFSVVVVVNFWIHVLTPLIFMLGLCCTRLFPYCGYCAYWNIAKTAMDNWTRRTRMALAVIVAAPLGLSMVLTGALSVPTCTAVAANSSSVDVTTLDVGDFFVTDSIRPGKHPLHIPVWLGVTGVAVLLTPLVYYVYDRYCKAEEGGPLIKRFANAAVVFYLLCGLSWSVAGFLWVFGARSSETCGADSFAYQFAFAALIIMNFIMDVWVCFKICVVLYWAFLTED